MRLSLSAVTPTSPLVQQIAVAINRQEGATQNNNPGNLMYVGQAGATGADSRGFAIFPTLSAGQAAEQTQVALLINRGTCANGDPVTNEAQLIGCWSPANDPRNAPGSTNTYIQNVSAWTGLDPNAPFDMSGGAPGVPTQALYGTDGDAVDASILPFDLSDPVTLAITLGSAGVLAWLYFRR